MFLSLTFTIKIGIILHCSKHGLNVFHDNISASIETEIC